MKKLALLSITMMILSSSAFSQHYQKVRISSKKVKFTLQDNTKEVFEIDSVAVHLTGRIFYLSSAEKKVTMEFLEEEQILRLTETFDGKPVFDSIDQINLSTVAVNRSGLK